VVPRPPLARIRRRHPRWVLFFGGRRVGGSPIWACPPRAA
jgi:hypothetical protein